MILCTEWNGLFDYDGKTLSPHPTAIDQELKSQQMNRAVMIPSDSTIVLGTIRNGIYAVDKEGKEKWHYDMEIVYITILYYGFSVIGIIMYGRHLISALH